jgi:hypothetical protein
LWAASAGASPSRPSARWTRSVLLLPACALLSVLIEFTQIYFPPRVVSLNDIARDVAAREDDAACRELVQTLAAIGEARARRAAPVRPPASGARQVSAPAA